MADLLHLAASIADLARRAVWFAVGALLIAACMVASALGVWLRDWWAA